MDQIEMENPADYAPKNFTDALREKYGEEDHEPANFSFIIMSPKRRNSSKEAELGHLNTVVLNDMRLKRAGIPKNGLSSLCPNIVDLDLQNNHFTHWSELLALLAELQRVKYVNLSQNFLRLDCVNNLPNKALSVENLVLNFTNIAIDDIVKLSNIMPVLKELHLCGNNYSTLGNIEKGISEGSLSSVECLRLNNNQINSWEEVWKLKDLPHLKNLILSGNPLAHIYYSFEDSKSSRNAPSEFRTSSPFPSDLEIIQHEEGENEVTKSLEACHLDDKNVLFQNDRESSLSCQIDSDDIELEFKDLSFSTLEYDEDDRDGRPFSRFARHDDSVLTDEEDEMSEKYINLEHEGNRNFNNSGREMQERYQYQFEGGDDSIIEADIFASVNFDAAVEAAVLESIHEAEVSVQEENDTWHKAVAEAFLHEIIENLVVECESRASSSITSQSPACACSNSSVPSSPASPMSLSSQPSSVSSLPSTCISASSTPGVTSVCPYDLQNAHIHPSVEKKDQTEFSSQLSEESCEENSDSTIQKNDNTIIENSMQTLPAPAIGVSDCRINGSESLISENKIFNLNQNAFCVASTSDSENSNTSLFNNIKRELNKTEINELVTLPIAKNPVSRSLFVSKRDSQTEEEYANCAKYSNQNMWKDSNKNLDEKKVRDDKIKSEGKIKKLPFSQLTSLCLSEARISHWSHLQDLKHYPKLTHIRMLENPLYKSIIPEDRRKLYISSLPTIKFLNGSEVTDTEREKAERYYLRHFMDHEEKPGFFQQLVDRHGPPVKLVDIDLSAGFKDSFILTFVLEEELKVVAKKGKTCFTQRIQNSGFVAELRKIASKEMGLPKRDFIMIHHQCGPSHPEHEREIMELRCEGLPISRFDFADGDEIHLKAKDARVIIN